MKKQFIAVTSGDPAGIGPVVDLLACRHPRVRARCRPVLVGDFEVFSRYASASSVRLRRTRRWTEIGASGGELPVWDVPHPKISELTMGRPQRIGGEAAVEALREAVRFVDSRRCSALVTAPVSKESLALAGVKEPGYTELLAAWGKVRNVEMLMCAGKLRALLLTRHIPLRRVSDALSVDKIVSSIADTDRWMKKHLGLRSVQWGLCGLNPHAGDGGLLGHEETRILIPAVKRLKSLAVAIDGPAPSDVFWSAHAAGRYDILACLYHDQAMIPLKTIAPGRIVNVTAGLPWIRTSPGHGTAFDLAPAFRTARAEPTIEAILTAVRLASAKGC
ncbi:MAG TPA: 4-hydroxythreonine-4-phosphate dehydrogenase PdxA [Elusimicrobiota bacterium]|nr:4-hydroxythreonine-4-phosphate dehydrogenase PdxA [Elusimicrobiota bacterium]